MAAGEAGDSDQSDPGTAGRIIAAERARGPAFDGAYGLLRRGSATGIQDAAVAIGTNLGLSDNRLEVMRRAALLHDVGKLSLPNTILDKPTRLTDVELNLVRAHPGLSIEILSRVQAFEEIAVLAGEHHEKLDGSGYPFGLTGKEMSVESKIIAVADVFAALSEHRPYREALGVERIRSIMEGDIPGKLDGECYAALCVAMEDLTRSVPRLPLSAHLPICISNSDAVEIFI